MTGNFFIFLAAVVFVLTSCSLEVDAPQAYVLFSGTNGDLTSIGGTLDDYAKYRYELRVKGPDGSWRSGLQSPEVTTLSNSTISAVSVLFEVPRLWVGRRYQFFICAFNDNSGEWSLLGRENQKIEKDTNFIRVGFEKSSGASPCKEE